MTTLNTRNHFHVEKVKEKFNTVKNITHTLKHYKFKVNIKTSFSLSLQSHNT